VFSAILSGSIRALGARNLELSAPRSHTRHTPSTCTSHNPSSPNFALAISDAPNIGRFIDLLSISIHAPSWRHSLTQREFSVKKFFISKYNYMDTSWKRLFQTSQSSKISFQNFLKYRDDKNIILSSIWYILTACTFYIIEITKIYHPSILID